ncbi:MAG: twin-arginine translocase subunit TatB [Zetaproteobacteria bacterium]|nr:MAG: twin-arginine translocase subunit TatB [Zetaproteobacteria bacterium]
MFGIGWLEMLVIGIVALLVVGPQRLPQAAQTIGRIAGYAMQQWRNIQQQIREPIQQEVIDVRNTIDTAIQDVEVKPGSDAPQAGDKS